ncbi:hypothetical protein ORV05_30475 [Amycolatopsis cynarae]|uniref:Uncharacterized protein n=1 Tax=Amycolatopsis cynarae TaxID=2995223 RepID=A0ABY7B2S3_9PSEU|nr:hypothetical protein [Amycolatopsis sp. HUAS 11-8]WAL65191.1 hypothetical protein ORV05_30475 [Amycolatopsis sp. HUAS 11-8]
MFDFGIDGYRPYWLTALAEMRREHGDRLAALVGRRLTATRLMWDLDSDEWWSDGPVVLGFEDEQVEINHQKFAELSITWNSIDTDRAPAVRGFRLGWRDDVPCELVALRGRRLSSVVFLQWRGEEGDVADGTCALHFDFAQGGSVTVANGLDENHLDFGVPESRWRRYPTSVRGRTCAQPVDNPVDNLWTSLRSVRPAGAESNPPRQ